MSSQETSNETTSISQLSISEPISTKSIITEISYNKGSITPRNSTTSSKLDSPLSNKQPAAAAATETERNPNSLNLDLSFANNFAATIQSTPDSVCQTSEPRVATPTAQQMNGLSFSELCFLFCCPPLPRAIAAKLAFLPPEPSYSFSSISNANGTAVSANNSTNLSSSLNSDSNDTNNTAATNNVAATPAPPPNSNQSYIEAKLSLTTRAEWQYTPRDLAKIEVCWSRTSKNNRIACMYVRAVAQPKFVILFSHGNAIDLGQMSSFYLSLGSRINCNVFSYDYSGYGVSTGKPSEKNIYADIDCAWNTLRNKYGITPERIILYGQSIGTVPTVDLASRFEVAAVILHSPLMSGFRIFTQTKRTWFFDSFPTIDKIPKVRAPVLVIHGTDDEVIDISHGLAIYERCARAVEPLFVEGAGHNDVELYSQYLERLRDFINNDLPAPS